MTGGYGDTQKIYANSLILTIFGDYICAHGGEIWLGSLIKLVAPLGISQRSVRTSVYRLTEKNMLQSRQVGRRSFYSLTNTGFRQFSTAAERIYRYDKYRWNGEWCLAFTTLNNLEPNKKEKFRNELRWLGFNRLSKGVYAHPMVKLERVNKVVMEMGLENSVVVMQARSTGRDPFMVSSNMIRYNFNFDTMKEEYRDYINCFEGLLMAAQSSKNKSAELCFLVRLMLIHRYRRILLGEPEIPRELIPTDCLNHRAREITEQLYKLICNLAESHFMTTGEAEGGALPGVDKEYFTRFGGISAQSVL